MKKRIFSLLFISVLLLSALMTAMVVPAAAAKTVEMTPMYGEPFQPIGDIFGRVSFIVPDSVTGMTKDAWDGNIDHNTDLILISYMKDGELYENKTIREIKAHLGDLAMVRTCYTFDDPENGITRLNLVFHMDDHDTLKPLDIKSVTLKAGFVWCAGSPAGITKELSKLTLDRDVTFLVKGAGGLTAPGNTTEADSVTEAPEKQGCGAVTALPAVLLILPLAAATLLKKRDHVEN